MIGGEKFWRGTKKWEEIDFKYMTEESDGDEVKQQTYLAIWRLVT